MFEAYIDAAAGLERNKSSIAEHSSIVKDSPKPTLIDIFCGAGIGAAGFLKAGFRIAAAVDIDEDACKVYEKNIGVKPIVGDLRGITGREILKSAGLKRGEATACSGCPPCQAFSSLRETTRVKGLRDRRKSLLRTYANRIEEILPRVVLLENVAGLAGRKNRRFLFSFVRRMEGLGYSCDYRVLNAADYGVAQRRRRLVLIGVREGKPALPEPTHSKDGKGGKPYHVKVAEVIRGLPPLRSGQASRKDPLHFAPKHSEGVIKLIRKIPKDGGSRSALPRSAWLDCHLKLGEQGAGSVYGRLSWQKVAGTITTRATTPSCGRFVHPSQNRGLSLREVAKLQSVPDDFGFEGTRSQIAEWIGNGMPTLLAEAVGRRTAQLAATFA